MCKRSCHSCHSLSPSPPPGVLYYGDTAGNNIKASQYVTDLSSDEDLAAFITSQPDRVLTVVNVSLLRWAASLAGRGV